MDINLIRAGQLFPFIAELKSCGLDPGVGLRRNWLPMAGDIQAQAPLPEQRVWAFIEYCARASRQRDLGWNVGSQNGLAHTGALGKALLSQPDLCSAMALLQQALRQFSSASQPALSNAGKLSWFRRGSLPGKGHGFWQVEQYAAAVYISLIRHYAGQEWTPPQLRTQAATSTARRSKLSSICGAVEGGHASLEIAIESDLLLPGATTPNFLPKWQVSPLPPLPGTYSEALRQVLQSYLSTYPISLATTAQVFDLQPRTIIRRLAREGLRFRDVRDAVREEYGRKLLTETDMPIAQIARKLDYSHHGHFSRAMKRMTGFSPRQIRAHQPGQGSM